MSEHAMLWLMLALPFAGSLAAAFLPARARNAAGILAGAVALAGAVLAGILYTQVADGTPLRAEIEWLPSLGLNLVLRLDGLSWIFAFLVLAVGFGGAAGAAHRVIEAPQLRLGARIHVAHAADNGVGLVVEIQRIVDQLLEIDFRGTVGTAAGTAAMVAAVAGAA